jgi:hypothetical protein
MIAIVLLTLCLGTSCETVRVPIAASMIECAIHGQQIATWWQREHPAYAEHRLRRWTCETGERI